jgi:hexosaminidase
MRIFSCFFTVAALLTLIPMGALFAQTPPALNIVPKPVLVQAQEGEFTINSQKVISYSPKTPEMERLAKYLTIAIAEIATNPLPWTANLSRQENVIMLKLEASAGEGKDEGYTLTIAPGRIMLSAPKPAGLFYGIQTLRQMLAAGGKRMRPSLPAVSITDYPRYGWRGISFDCARHFHSKEAVRRYIDLLAYHKMNVFHWHLTDDQGWRIEIKKYPKLTEVGAWRDEYGRRHGGYYTQKDIREVIAYAAERYITVVPEIEMPGHATAALAAYPEFFCTGEQLKVEAKWGVFPNLFCAGKEETFAFLEDVLREVAALFPSEYIHIGGDEASKDIWKKCPHCQARIKAEGLKDEAALQGYFSRRMDTFVRSLGKTMIGWDEILEGVPSTTAVVESWRGMEGAVEGAASGHRIISAPSGSVYFDYPELNERSHIWWMGVTPMEKVYAFEATPKELTPEQASFILGGECALWSEHIREFELDYKIFPRLCAFSETVWTPGEQREWQDFTRRMETQKARLNLLGVDYFTPATLVGKWSPDQVDATTRTLEWEATPFVGKPGYYRFTIRHDEGKNGTAIESAALVQDGKEIWRDTHPGRTSVKRNELHNYYMEVKKLNTNRPVMLRVTMTGDGGADTAGTVWVRYFSGN